MKNKITTIKDILQKTGLLLFIVGLISLSIIYFYQQKLSTREQIKEATAIAEIIKHSITNNAESVKTKEKLIDLYLYVISKSIAKELEGKTIKDVSQVELDRLKEKWGLDEISLFVYKDNDFIVEKATDPKEIGLSAKDWGYWFDAMMQLYKLEPVTVKEGFANENYWAGPLSLSEIVDQYYKYVYYYDQTTDFIINPYISADEVYLYTSTSSTDILIEKLKNIDYHNVYEIAVINKDAYLHPKEIIEPEKDLPILYGSNHFALDSDRKIIASLKPEDTAKTHNFTNDGKNYNKLFIPINKQQILSVVIGTDKHTTLEMQFLLLLLAVFILSFIAIAIMLFVINKKSFKVLIAEQERLALAEDFKRTMEILPEAIFNARIGIDNSIIINYNEGTLVEELNLTTAKVKGKKITEVYPEAIYKVMIPAINRGFEGAEFQSNFAYKDKIYQLVVKPTYNHEVAGYAIDITKEKESERKIEKLALFDALTGLPNRYSFNRQIEQLINHYENKNGKFALFYIDIDNFKTINDTKGHSVGDQLLIMVAERMLHSLTNTPAFLARMGGDEFTLLIEYYNDKTEIMRIAEKLLNSFKKCFILNTIEYTITSSIGISLYPHDGKELNILLKNADIAMYKSKENNKNSYSFFLETMAEERLRKVSLENSLRHAIKNKQLYLHYQPQYNIQTQTMIGAEALLRWNHPQYGNISPAEFIPIAEETNLIVDIGEWVILEACSQFKVWEDEGLDIHKIAINLSKIQLLDPNILERIKQILIKLDFNPRNLTFEITESATVNNIDQIMLAIEKMRSLGIEIAIDDFGIEYSSLKYLKNIPLDIIKIDRSFISELEYDHKNKNIVKFIIEFANDLGLKVIAEGVETKEQTKILENLGCQGIQGYYYSKPLDKKEITKLINNSNKAKLEVQ